MVPPAGFQKTYKDVEAGTWSDDGAQALCLLDSLLSQGGLSLNSFSDLLSAWYEDGLWAVNNVVFDVGIQTGNGVLVWASGNTKRLAFHAAGEGQGRKIAGTVLFKPWVYLRFSEIKCLPADKSLEIEILICKDIFLHHRIIPQNLHQTYLPHIPPAKVIGQRHKNPDSQHKGSNGKQRSFGQE